MHQPAQDAPGTDAALAAIVRSSQDAVIATTLDGIVTAWNAGAEQVYGYPAAEMVGCDLATSFTPETADADTTSRSRPATPRRATGARGSDGTARGSRW